MPVPESNWLIEQIELWKCDETIMMGYEGRD